MHILQTELLWMLLSKYFSSQLGSFVHCYLCSRSFFFQRFAYWQEKLFSWIPSISQLFQHHFLCNFHLPSFRTLFCARLAHMWKMFPFSCFFFSFVFQKNCHLQVFILFTFNSMKSNRKINIVNIYLTTNFEQINGTEGAHTHTLLYNYKEMEWKLQVIKIIFCARFCQWSKLFKFQNTLEFYAEDLFTNDIDGLVLCITNEYESVNENSSPKKELNCFVGRKRTEWNRYEEYVWRAGGIQENQSKENPSRWKAARKAKSIKQSIWNQKFVIIKVQFRAYGWCWHKRQPTQSWNAYQAKQTKLKRGPPPIE